MNFVECDQLIDLVRGGQGEFIQAGSGQCRGSMRQINLDGLEMLFADMSNTTVVHAAADPDIAVVHVLLDWTGEMRWNGRAMRHPTAIVWGMNPEWSRIGSNATVATLGFDRELLSSRLASWSGRDPGDCWDFQGEALDFTAGTRQLLESVQEVGKLSAQSPEAFNSPDQGKTVIDSMLSSVFQAALAGDNSRTGSQDLSFNSRMRAVSKVREYLREKEHQDLSLLTLCAVAGVSARTLDYAFKENLGMGPMRYLRIRRLNRARKILRDGEAGEIRVATCASAAGFNHPGRFSQEYKRLFGELPSETAARSH